MKINTNTQTHSHIKPSAEIKEVLDKAVSLIKERKQEEAYILLNKKLDSLDKDEQISLNFYIYDLFIKNNASYALEALDSILKINPNSTLALLLKAKFFESQRKKKNVIETLRRLITLDPTHKQLVECARIFSKFGEQSLALEAAKRAYMGSGEDVSISTYPLRVALQNADWDFAEKIQEKILNAYHDNKYGDVNETPRTHLLWCDNEEINFNVIKNFANQNFKSKSKDPLVIPPDDDISKRKIRVAYLSNDFRDHPTSYLMMGMLRHHNKNRFEVIIYDTSYDDGMATRRQVFSRANLVKDISKLNDAQAASIISKDKIDVLVDLNGLTEGSRLGIFSFRPAPVQISYLGFPGSTGTSFVDYIIADDYTVPKSSEQYYSEAIIRIQNTYQINDYIAKYLPPKPSLKQLGLPEGKPIIGMFNNVNKVGRQVWDTWMRIMQAIPDAVFWMLDPGDIAKSNLMASAKNSGIDINRFYWTKRNSVDEHIARIPHCSIIFDPWPYGGHTTTSDALFAGVPVIALEGHNFASRVSGGLLIAAGLKSLVAKDVDDYVNIATRLLNDHKLLFGLKQHLNKNRRRLTVFDAVGRTLQIEGAYVHALTFALKKTKPTSFNIMKSARKKEGL